MRMSDLHGLKVGDSINVLNPDGTTSNAQFIRAMPHQCFEYSTGYALGSKGGGDRTALVSQLVPEQILTSKRATHMTQLREPVYPHGESESHVGYTVVELQGRGTVSLYLTSDLIEIP